MRTTGIENAAQFLEAQGRKGDDSLAHVTTGETIVPEVVLNNNPQLKKELQEEFTAMGLPMDSFVVGSGIMSINPATGLQEAGILDEVKKGIKKLGPTIGAVVGGVFGGPAGAAAGAAIGSKTSADTDNLFRNVVLAYGGANIAQGAGVPGAFDSAKTAFSAAGGFSNPLTATGDFLGAMFNPANYTPMAGGQSGIGGFFQNIGSGAARNLRLGGNVALSDPSLGLSRAQQQAISQNMLTTGNTAFDAALEIGIKDMTILGNLGSVRPDLIGPGIFSSIGQSYAGLNPLEQFGLQTGFDIVTGIADEQGGYSSSNQMAPPAYFSSPLRTGGAIPNLTGVDPSQLQELGGIASIAPSSVTNVMSDVYAPTNAQLDRNDQLLEQLAGRLDQVEDPGLAALLSVTTPFPEFSLPTYAAEGGIVGTNRKMFEGAKGKKYPNKGLAALSKSAPDVVSKMGFAEGGAIFEGGGKVDGPGGEKEDLINAKLSDNEFVMTADAVRGAGNGSIERGAEKMYDLMDKFEKRA